VRSSTSAVTIASLHQMKREGKKIVGVVAWDYQIARIVDRVGVEIVSVGDSVGMNLWGQPGPSDVTLDEMMVVCKAVRRGVTRALLSCDFPPGPLQAGTHAARDAAVRFAEGGGADMVKLDGAVRYLEAVAAITAVGIPVFAQMEVTPGIEVDGDMRARLVEEAKRLEDAGALLIDFKHSGPVAGPAVAGAVGIPVIGGLGGGPWLDGRLRMAHAAIGYDASNLDSPVDTYANVAQVAFDAISAYVDDVRAGRQIKSGKRAGL
jgi:3-methyl-2-oxobutanoate hydroxymethyltransferase